MRRGGGFSLLEAFIHVGLRFCFCWGPFFPCEGFFVSLRSPPPPPLQNILRMLMVYNAIQRFHIVIVPEWFFPRCVLAQPRTSHPDLCVMLVGRCRCVIVKLYHCCTTCLVILGTWKNMSKNN